MRISCNKFWLYPYFTTPSRSAFFVLIYLTTHKIWFFFFLFNPLSTLHCLTFIWNGAYFRGLSTHQGHTIKKNWPSFFRQLSNANSNSASGEFHDYLIPTPWNFVWLEPHISGACWHSHCEFIDATVLFCPESTLSLKSSIPSSFSNLSVTSPMTIPKPWSRGMMCLLPWGLNTPQFPILSMFTSWEIPC